MTDNLYGRMAHLYKHIDLNKTIKINKRNEIKKLMPKA